VVRLVLYELVIDKRSLGRRVGWLQHTKKRLLEIEGSIARQVDGGARMERRSIPARSPPALCAPPRGRWFVWSKFWGSPSGPCHRSRIEGFSRFERIHPSNSRESFLFCGGVQWFSKLRSGIQDPALMLHGAVGAIAGRWRGLPTAAQPNLWKSRVTWSLHPGASA
jgi:hypothetical protein